MNLNHSVWPAGLLLLFHMCIDLFLKQFPADCARLTIKPKVGCSRILPMSLINDFHFSIYLKESISSEFCTKENIIFHNSKWLGQCVKHKTMWSFCNHFWHILNENSTKTIFNVFPHRLCKYILNLMSATHFKQVVTGATKYSESHGMLKNTFLKHSRH